MQKNFKINLGQENSHITSSSSYKTHVESQNLLWMPDALTGERFTCEFNVAAMSENKKTDGYGNQLTQARGGGYNI